MKASMLFTNMKGILFFVVTMVVITTAQCQVTHSDTCISGLQIPIRAFINGERDTTDKNGPQKIINRSLLVNGFNLLLTDTTYEIIRYEISFIYDDPFFTLVVAPNRGAKLELSPEFDRYLKKMKKRELFGIDRVWVRKNNQCYLIDGTIYYTD
jgi:hypothetical protein